MKKVIIFNHICLLVFFIFLCSCINEVEATEVNDESEINYTIGHLYLEKEKYVPGDYIELAIYTDIYDKEILNINYNSDGFDLFEDFETNGTDIYFSVKHQQSSQIPNFEILIEFLDQTLSFTLYGRVEDGMLFVNPYSYDEAYQAYLYYLKQNNILKYEQIQSQLKPITSNNMISVQTPSTGQITLNSTSEPDTFLSGKFQWKDDYNQIHPLRFSLVQLWDKELIGERMLMETLTNENGEYSFAFKNASGVLELENGGYDIFIRVKPAGEDVTVYRGNGSEYYVDFGYYEDSPTGVLEDVSFTFNMSDGEFSRAVQISQATIFASKYYEEMKGSDVGDVTIKYPHNEKSATSFYRSSEETIYMLVVNNPGAGLPKSYASWDVIMHEYGHHISNMEGITDSPGGKHTGNQSMSSHYLQHFIDQNRDCELNCIVESSSSWPFEEDECKYEGMALAWSEAIATYFMVAAQEYYSSYLSSIYFVNDKSYTSYNGVNYNIEHYQGKFHDSENSITAVLYDLYDNSSSETFDVLSLEHKEMFDFIVNSEANTFYEFYEYFRTNYTGDKSAFSNFGLLLEYHCFSTTNPQSFSELTQMCPTFDWTWTEPSDTSKPNYFTNRSFLLNFYDKNRNLIYQTTPVSTQSYTLTEAEWTIIMNASSEFYVSVVICENNEPMTEYESGWAHFNRPTVYDIYYNTPITKTFVGDDCYWFEFIAPQDGTYIIQSTGNVDTYANLFNRIVAGKIDYESIDSDDDDGEGYNFLIEFPMVSGESVLIRVRTFNWNKTGDFTINITGKNHHHSYTYSYVSIDETNHRAYCACGDSIVSVHNYNAFKTGHKCIECMHYTTGPVHIIMP